MRSPALTLRLFPWFSALSFTPIMVPTLVLFWQDCGLDTFEIYLLQAAFAIAMVILEVPTGMVADRVGKRASLLSGQCIVFIGAVIYALGAGFWTFLLAEVTLAFGMALLSGADSAILYDSLQSLGRQEEFLYYEGRNHSLRLLLFAVCNIIGGLLADLSLRAPMWASVVGPALAIPIVFLFSDVRQATTTSSLREALAGYRALMKEALRFVSKHRLVRWIVVFQAILVGSATWLLWSYQPYMTLTGVPVWAFGLIFALYQLGAALSSRIAGRLVTRLGDRATWGLLAALQAGTPLLMGLFPNPGASALVLGHQAVRGIVRPVLSARMLAYTHDDKRATVLSLASLAGRLFFAGTGPLIGLLNKRRSLLEGLVVQGLVLLGLFALLAWELQRIPEKYWKVKS